MSSVLREREMYIPVAHWLESFLQARHRSRAIRAFDTSAVQLYRWIEQQGLQKDFPEYLAYDVRVDVTAIVQEAHRARLAFVECKLHAVTLRDVSQILGYCRVARPQSAWIVSPRGISTHLAYLLRTYHRFDVLEYTPSRPIRIATWNHSRREIEAASVLPPGPL